MSETFAMVDPEIFAAVQEMIEKDSTVKEVSQSGGPFAQEEGARVCRGVWG